MRGILLSLSGRSDFLADFAPNYLYNSKEAGKSKRYKLKKFEID